jgi:hypothetical protein
VNKWEKEPGRKLTPGNVKSEEYMHLWEPKDFFLSIGFSKGHYDNDILDVVFPTTYIHHVPILFNLLSHW